mgnify:FL=1|jgi:hypothetical protein
MYIVPFLTAKEENGMKSFYKWITEYVEEENYWVKEEEGISYYFCEDTIMEDFFTIANIDEDIFYADDYEVLKPLWDVYEKEHNPFSYTDKDIKDYKKEANADARMSAMEMGWGTCYTTDSDGWETYYPNEW